MVKDINCSCCYIIAWGKKNLFWIVQVWQSLCHISRDSPACLPALCLVIISKAFVNVPHQSQTYSNHPKCFLSQGWTAGVLHGSDHTKWLPVLCSVIFSPTPTLSCIQLSEEMRSLVRRLRLKWAASWAVLLLGLDGGGIIVRFEQVAC